MNSRWLLMFSLFLRLARCLHLARPNDNSNPSVPTIFMSDHEKADSVLPSDDFDTHGPANRVVVPKIRFAEKLIEHELGTDPLAMYYPAENSSDAEIFDLEAERQKRQR